MSKMKIMHALVAVVLSVFATQVSAAVIKQKYTAVVTGFYYNFFEPVSSSFGGVENIGVGDTLNGEIVYDNSLPNIAQTPFDYWGRGVYYGVTENNYISVKKDGVEVAPKGSSCFSCNSELRTVSDTGQFSPVPQESFGISYYPSFPSKIYDVDIGLVYTTKVGWSKLPEYINFSDLSSATMSIQSKTGGARFLFAQILNIDLPIGLSSPVPEPSSLYLLSLGFVIFMLRTKRVT